MVKSFPRLCHFYGPLHLSSMFFPSSIFIFSNHRHEYASKKIPVVVIHLSLLNA
jgi:hypothetical protein